MSYPHGVPHFLFPPSVPANERIAWVKASHPGEYSGAVAKVILFDADFRQDIQKQARHRCVGGILDMTSALELSRSASGQEEWHRRTRVIVAVPHAATIHDERVVQQRPLTVGRRA